MYRLVNTETGEAIGVTEIPRFIRRNDKGNLVEAKQKHATGVAYQGEPYNLLNTEGVGAKTTVLLNVFDVADEMAQTRADLDFIMAMEDLI